MWWKILYEKTYQRCPRAVPLEYYGPWTLLWNQIDIGLNSDSATNGQCQILNLSLNFYLCLYILIKTSNIFPFHLKQHPKCLIMEPFGLATVDLFELLPNKLQQLRLVILISGSVHLHMHFPIKGDCSSRLCMAVTVTSLGPYSFIVSLEKSFLATYLRVPSCVGSDLLYSTYH